MTTCEVVGCQHIPMGWIRVENTYLLLCAEHMKGFVEVEEEIEETEGVEPKETDVEK